MPSDDDRFAGFGADFPAFFAGLEADNSKAWFDARRDVYERAIREPLERLVAEARGAYGTYAKVFRANRDVRFSADKRPYRTDAVGGVADERTRVISYVRLDRDGLVAGAGWLHPDRDQLATARAAIATDAGAARELQRALDDLAAGGFDCDGDPLRAAPKGYPRGPLGDRAAAPAAVRGRAALHLGRRAGRPGARTRRGVRDLGGRTGR
jgi:uncharacterized protein (TIGR02453 family)